MDNNEEKNPVEEPQSTGLIQPVEIDHEMRTAYIDYSMSVIVSRALPDEMGVKYTGQTKKSARIVGDVMGKYHPHGDSSVYDAMVRLGQWWNQRYPMVWGQGNFGSMDGDSPAAMRYTEAKLEKMSEDVLADMDKDTVDMDLNFPSDEGPAAAAERCFRHRRRHGHEHGSAQPRRMLRRHLRLYRQPGDHHGRTDAVHQGSRLPDRRHRHGPQRHPGGLRDRPRPRRGALQDRYRGGRQGSRDHRRHRDPLHGEQARDDREDRAARRREEDRRHFLYQRRELPRGYPRGDPPQAGRELRRRAEHSVQVHPAAVQLLVQQRRPREGPPAHPLPQGDPPQLRRLPPRGGGPPHEVRTGQGEKVCSRPWTSSTRSST